MSILTRLILPVLALCAAMPLAAQSVQDFQLPPEEEDTQTPQAQGPVDTESGNLPATPRVIETPSTQPTRTPQRVETVQPLPTTTAAGTTTRPPAPAPRQPDLGPQRQPKPIRTTPPRLPLDPGETVPMVPEEVPTTEPTLPTIEAAPTQPTQSPEPASEARSADAGDWTWPLVGVGVLALLGIGYLLSRRRGSAIPAQIERPIVGGPATIAPDQLKVLAEPIKLTRSVMNATLHYRVSLMNRAPQAISNVTVGADLVSAHGQLPVEQQVASASQPLEARHTFDRIAPGQSVRYDGQIIVPIAQVRAIRQGNAALFVPLLRLRVDGASAEPLVKTFVVGAGIPGGGRVMPFRFDEGPRSWEPIAARALD